MFDGFLSPYPFWIRFGAAKVASKAVDPLRIIPHHRDLRRSPARGDASDRRLRRVKFIVRQVIAIVKSIVKSLTL